MNIKEIEQKAASALGLEFDTQADLTDGERLRLWDKMAEIALQNRASLPPSVVEWAARRTQSALYGTSAPSYSFTEAVSDFVGEVGNQAANLNQDLNPFSEANRRSLYMTVVGGLLLYVLAPAIGDLIRNATQK